MPSLEVWGAVVQLVPQPRTVLPGAQGTALLPSLYSGLLFSCLCGVRMSESPLSQ